MATPYTLIYILIATAAVYFATAFLEKGGRKAATAGVIAVVINAVLWFALKGYALWAPLFQVMGITVKAPVAALGMGYYTLQAVGYILDCYWGNSKPLKNPLQLLLFLCFFPQMITRHIRRFNGLEDMNERRGLSYQNLTYGAQRILWGFFKKLVLAERVGVLVTAIWGNLLQYNGFYSWIAFVAFPLQLMRIFPDVSILRWEQRDFSESDFRRISILRFFQEPHRNSGRDGISLWEPGPRIIFSIRC